MLIKRIKSIKTDLYIVLGWLILVGIANFVAYIIDSHNNSESVLMKKAKKDNSISTYIKYTELYPEGEYIKEACDSVCSKLLDDRRIDYLTKKKRIYSYLDKVENKQLKIRLCRIAYQQTVEERSIDNWKSFIKYIPKQYQRDAYKQMYALEKEIWGTEQKAWFYIKSKNEVDAYYEFMNKFPNGKYYKLAKKEYIDLKVENDFDKLDNYETLPKSNKFPKNEYNFYSTLMINNSSNYEIEILFSGEYSDMLILNPGHGFYIELPNGEYFVSVNYKSPDSKICIGTENLTGGKFWVKY